MSSEPCALDCGKPVNPHDLGTWKEVRGFVGGPKKDHMRLREYTGRVAHDSCVAKLQEGQAVTQPSLMDKQPRVKKADRVPVEPEVEEFFNG